MKQIELFYLKSCPYCRNAKKAIGELTEENPVYADIRIEWIEESEQPEIAEERDYAPARPRPRPPSSRPVAIADRQPGCCRAEAAPCRGPGS